MCKSPFALRNVLQFLGLVFDANLDLNMDIPDIASPNTMTYQTASYFISNCEKVSRSDVKVLVYVAMRL